MTVFILTPDERVVSLNRLSARIGFLALGESVHMFEPDEVETLPLQLGDIVVGGVGFAQTGMRRLGLEIPVVESVPPEVAPFAGRRIWNSTLGELRSQISGGGTIFAKPVAQNLKTFDGTLFSRFRDLIPTAHLPDDTPIECADPIALISEFRCFVLHGDVIGLRHYKGDPLVFPDPAIIQEAIGAYDTIPAGCAIDFGVLDTGQTVIVEVNDGYAVGAYGLAPVRYAQIILARWNEIRAFGA